MVKGPLGPGLATRTRPRAPRLPGRRCGLARCPARDARRATHGLGRAALWDGRAPLRWASAYGMGEYWPMARGAGRWAGPSAAIASRLAPGRHDASWVLVVKFSSATRLSPLAGQPKPTRASLLAQVCGTTVSRPLAMDTDSSCTAS